LILDEGATAISWKKKVIFLEMVLEPMDRHIEKKASQLLHVKITSKWVID
jgi:hypothetical protein